MLIDNNGQYTKVVAAIEVLEKFYVRLYVLPSSTQMDRFSLYTYRFFILNIYLRRYNIFIIGLTISEYIGSNVMHKIQLLTSPPIYH